MSEKISLKKNDADSNVDIQEINKKLDLLINEVATIKKEMNLLQSKNEAQSLNLDSRLHNVCGDLKEHIYKLQSTIYEFNSDWRDGIYKLSSKITDSNYKVEREVRELQNQTTSSNFLNKFLPWSPVIIFGGTIWLLILLAILE